MRILADSEEEKVILEDFFNSILSMTVFYDQTGRNPVVISYSSNNTNVSVPLKKGELYNLYYEHNQGAQKLKRHLDFEGIEVDKGYLKKR